MALSYPKCNQAGVEYTLMTGEDLQEKVLYLSEDLPIAMFTQAYRGGVSDYIPFHWHEALQLTWVTRGCLLYQINGEEFCLKQDRLLLINRHQLHCCSSEKGDADTLCINFELSIFHPALQQQLIGPFLEESSFAYLLLPLSPGRIETLRCFSEWQRLPLEYFSVLNFISALLEEVIRDHSRESESYRSDDMILVENALNLIHAEYAQELSVREIAVRVLTNKNRLTELFNRYTGMPPARYLNHYRLHCGRELLLRTDRSVSDISSDVGYNQISHFVEQFRKTYGLSPLKYRKKYALSADQRDS